MTIPQANPTLQVVHKPPVNYRIAEFGFGMPSPTKPIAGVVVLTDGSNSDGRRLVNHPSWEEFAKEEGLVLCGSHLVDEVPTSIEGYADASGGSGQALLDAVDKYLVEEGKIEDPTKIPLFLWGFSAGGQFSYEFACWKPERVGGFVANKGGVYYHALAPKATRELPAMWFLGLQDAGFRVAIIQGIYLLNRQAGADRWYLVEEPVGHAIGRSEFHSIQFFKRILRKRELAR